MQPGTDHRHIIALGRAYVCLIEAAQVIAEYSEHDAEQTLMAELVADYRDGLRQLVATLPAHVTAEIMAASEKVLGPVQEQGVN